MGITVWQQRATADALAADPTEVTLPAGPAEAGGEADRDAVAGMDWERLARSVAACTACELHRTRTNTVFGVGDRKASLMVIGEAPGADEDRRGEPFVGRAGQLLNSMLRAIGLRREAVFIANILKCRPPGNRDPKPEEVVACADFLGRQIALLQPRAILAVGRIAAQNLLEVDTPIGRMRGQRYEYADTGIPVVVTYHPAYLLRTPADKRKSWRDLMTLRELLGEASS
ncbi:MAG: uracil-DNA glycosylase [Gammaproteobacteria bacterium]|nr:uracil-DNA glycosylase [Gammaproteobacteria bacterium]